MALIDEVKIHVISGAGGNGCVSFRREKFVPYGGPNGGNGGRGGDVYLSATRDKTSLLDFKFRPKFEAERGEHGMGSDCFGHAGKDLIIQVPTGTLVYDDATGDLLGDLTQNGQTLLIAKGGSGGRGNLSFKTSTNRAPRTRTMGVAGEEKNLRLELQLIADVGLVGLPNAGKSSFLQAVTRAKPKIADYPFTTLEPHLGVVQHKDQAFVIADLPGLIEGAADGAGLGHQFLRHVTRNRILLHLVDVNDDVETIQNNIAVIRKELEAYDSALISREELLIFTKIDLLTEEDLAFRTQELKDAGLSGYFISSKAAKGLEPLLNYLSIQAQSWKLEEAPIEELPAQVTDAVPLTVGM